MEQQVRPKLPEFELVPLKWSKVVHECTTFGHFFVTIWNGIQLVLAIGPNGPLFLLMIKVSVRHMHRNK